MRERMRLIRDKALLERQDLAGNKARAEFVQATRYDVRMSQRLSVVLDNVSRFPDQNFGELALLCDIYGSDKGSMTDDPKQHPYAPLPSHTYTDIYETIFQRDGFKNRATAIFECGIGTNNPGVVGNMTVNGKPGASLRVWRDYFHKAEIWGADIDRNILFEEDRIKTDYMDQTSPKAIRNFFEKCGVRAFDVMIDDGLHTFDAAKTLFEIAVEYLADDGIYSIEDLSLVDIKKLYLLMKSYKQYAVKYLIMDAPHNWNNNLVIIKKNSDNS